MVKIARVRSVYKQLGDFVHPQTIALRKIQAELRETESAARDISQSFLSEMARRFPRVDDLPLEAMTTANRLRKPTTKQDYMVMVSSMRQKNALLREELTGITQNHGDETTLRENLQGADRNYRTALQAEQSIASTHTRLGAAIAPLGERLLPITIFEMAHNRPFTAEDARLYSKGSWWRWINRTWREGRATWITYTQRGGNNLEADRTTFASLNARSEEAATRYNAAKQTAEIHKGEYDRIQQILRRIGQLQHDYMSESDIHTCICADFAQILGHPVAARYFVATLPPASGAAIAAFAVKRQQHDEARARLSAAETVIRARLDAIAGHRSELQAHNQTHPQTEIIYDIDDARKQQADLLQAIDDIIGYIRHNRTVLQDQFNPSSGAQVSDGDLYDTIQSQFKKAILPPPPTGMDTVLPNGEPANDETGQPTQARPQLQAEFTLPALDLPAIAEEPEKPTVITPATDWGNNDGGGNLDISSPTPD